VLAWAGGGDLGAARIAYARDFDTTSLATDLDAIFRVLRDGDVPSVKRAARLQLARAVSPDAPPAEEASTAAEVETLAELDRRALAARSSATTSPPAGTAPAGAPAQPAGNAGPITGPGAEVP
jgi:predicted Zn-dependent protease